MDAPMSTPPTIPSYMKKGTRKRDRMPSRELSSSSAVQSPSSAEKRPWRSRPCESAAPSAAAAPPRIDPPPAPEHHRGPARPASRPPHHAHRRAPV
eukprot:5660672-Prymnesium_polylepis.3